MRDEFDKYHVQSVDGQPPDPKARFYVLRLDQDPTACRALEWYAAEKIKEHPEQGQQIMQMLQDLQEPVPLGWTWMKAGSLAWAKSEGSGWVPVAIATAPRHHLGTADWYCWVWDLRQPLPPHYFQQRPPTLDPQPGEVKISCAGLRRDPPSEVFGQVLKPGPVIVPQVSHRTFGMWEDVDEQV